MPFAWVFFARQGQKGEDIPSSSFFPLLLLLIPKTWCLTRAQGQKDLWQDGGTGLYTEALLYVSVIES